MILHARKCTFHPLPHQYWRGLRPFMQLHEKRHMKCVGEAGEVLRASGNVRIYFGSLKTSLYGAGSLTYQ
ncbi:hypothetical protein DX900_13245 [Serratia marcescens]|nr:hypothetical protein DX900_13245 [Serratia marcescens]TFZ78622.1 hypothetical protein E4655_23355 [Serratia marcescens]